MALDYVFIAVLRWVQSVAETILIVICVFMYIGAVKAGSNSLFISLYGTKMEHPS